MALKEELQYTISLQDNLSKGLDHAERRAKAFELALEQANISATRFRTGTSGASRSTSDFRATIDQAGRSTKDFRADIDRGKRSTRDFRAELDRGKRSARGLKSELGGLGGQLSRLKAQALGAFSAFQLFQGVRSTVTIGAEFEAAEIGLTTLLKDADEARIVFDQIKQDAQTTPFDVKGLLMGNRALIAAGVEAKKAREDVLNLGNAVAATGGGNDELKRMIINLQQIKNIGRASALDIKQFGFAGINIYKLLEESTGKNIDQLKGQNITYAMLTKALKVAHDAGGLFEGGLERMSKTTGIMISNLQDQADLLQADIFVKYQEGINETIQSTMDLLSWTRDNIDSIARFGKALLVSIAIIKTASFFIVLHNSYLAAQASATAALTVRQWALNFAMNANPVALMITAIAALTFGLYKLATSYNAVEIAKKKMTPTKGETASTKVRTLKFIKETADALVQNEKMLKVDARRSVVKQAALDLERSLYETQKRLNRAVIAENDANIIKEGKRKNLIKFQLQLLEDPRLNEMLDKVKDSKGLEFVDLGSELSTPKASRIKNITINMGGVMANMTNNFETAEEGIEDFIGKLSEALNTVVTDAAIIATE